MGGAAAIAQSGRVENTAQIDRWQRSIEVIEEDGRACQRRLFSDREGGARSRRRRMFAKWFSRAWRCADRGYWAIAGSECDCGRSWALIRFGLKLRGSARSGGMVQGGGALSGQSALRSGQRAEYPRAMVFATAMDFLWDAGRPWPARTVSIGLWIRRSNIAMPLWATSKSAGAISSEPNARSCSMI